MKSKTIKKLSRKQFKLKPTKVIKDKKTYTRKKKHKDDDDKSQI
jgi:hypothetical protein